MLDVDKYYRGNEVKVDKDTLAQKGFLGRSGKTSTEQHLSKDLQEVREWTMCVSGESIPEQ